MQCYCKNAHRLCFIFGGGGRGVLRPVAREGLKNLGSFLATKWAKNVVILVGLGLEP